MDVICRHCREPWDLDSLHEEAGMRYGVPFHLNETDRLAYRKNPAYDSDAYAKVFDEVRQEFYRDGCGALREFGAKPCTPQGESSAVVGMVYELLGDDVDGAAAMLEDAEQLGLI
jgi:hypothetical protein